MKRLHMTSGLGVSRPVWYASKNGTKTSFQYAAVKSAWWSEPTRNVQGRVGGVEGEGGTYVDGSYA